MFVGCTAQLSDAWVRLREVQEQLDAAKRDKVCCTRCRPSPVCVPPFMSSKHCTPQVTSEVAYQKQLSKCHHDMLSLQSKLESAQAGRVEAEQLASGLTAQLRAAQRSVP